MFNVVFFGSNGKALASKIDVSSLQVGDGLYYKSSQLSGKTFANEFASIVSGRYMFASSNIKTFSGSLTSLQDGTRMFEATGSFTSFTSEMPNLSNGTYMFYNTPLLASFSSSLPNLRIGECMFQNAKILPSFSVSLPKLTNGSRMFDGCASLETFNSVLPSLENGTNMFSGCKLSAKSLFYIINTLPTYTSGSHPIMFGINALDTDEDRLRFAQELKYSDWASLQSAFTTKGWTPSWQYNAPAAPANTLSMFTSSSPIWFKLEEVMEHDAPYELVTEEGDKDTEKRYNCSWFHSGADTEGYEYFGSFLEAFGYHGVIPVEFKEY